jgi:hypothetical protein
MAKKRRPSGKRFRLLIYERMWKRWAFPCLLIIPASVALWWSAPRLFTSFDLLLHRLFSFLPPTLIMSISAMLQWFAPLFSIIHILYRFLALIPALVTLILMVFTFLSRRTAWIQCRPNHLRIRTPFYPLVVSYGRIKEVLPQPFAQIFNPAEKKAARRNWLQPYWGQTALMIRVSKYPVKKAWLRLWFSPYLLAPKGSGFVLLVDDWMGFSRQLDDFRTNWEMRHAEARQKKLANRTW